MTPLGLRARLFAMMLLEYAIWGAWAAVAGKYFIDPPPRGLGFPGAFSGLLFSLLPLGSMITPVLVGQIADRWMRAERLQGILSILCGVVLYAMAGTTDQGRLLALMMVYAFLFAPTTMLTNSIAFAHLQHASKEFGSVRVGGTLGWFLALGVLGAWRSLAPEPVPGDLFYLAAGFSVALGLYSFTLPATHPSPKSTGVPFVGAVSLLKKRNFRRFYGCAFALGLTLDFYYIFVSAYLGSPALMGGVGFSSASIPAMMMLPQASELVVMAFLGASLPRLGVRRALLIGFCAWVVRYFLLMVSPDPALATAALLLHGLCFTFVFAVASLYVNQIAPAGIRASAQALVTVGLFGLARFLGSHLSGIAHDMSKQRLERPTTINGIQYELVPNWPVFFAIPLAVTALATFVLFVTFKEPKTRSQRVKV